MEKRSLVEMIFGNKQKKYTTTNLQMMNGYKSEFTTIDNNVYNSKIARQCIDRIATHTAKLMPKHIKGKEGKLVNGDINFLLQNRPNPMMNTYTFIYKTISMLYTDSNAFIFKKFDDNGFIEGFYPVLASSYNLLEDNKGIIYLKFKFVNGREYTLPLKDLIHLKLYYNKHDIFGERDYVLKTDVETAHVASEGMKNAIKTSNSLKGILKYSNSMIKEKDIKANRDQFVKDFISSMDDESGIAGLDAKADFKEINLKPITLDSDQLKMVNNNIYDYYGISEKIVKNNYSSEEWNAFFEGVIEPLAIQMSDEFTTNIFSKQAIKDGNKIVFTTNRLQYASLDQKINLIKVAGAYGLITKDDGREILDLPPIGGEEGSKILQSLNNIDSSIANNYQGGQTDEGK